MFNDKNEQEKQIANRQLNDMIHYAESFSCRRIPLLKYFGENYPMQHCNMCDICIESKEKKNRKKIDISIAAQKFLSCVKRTGEMFGQAHIIRVLHGSRDKKILKFSHDSLSTYGIGKEYSRKQWHYMSRIFLQMELMTKDTEYGSLKLTPKAWSVFKGEEKVFADAESLGNEARDSRNIYQKSSISSQPADYDATLFELLRKKRKELADDMGVPPYVIFSDKTLTELATWRPHSREGFLTIHGIGETKLEKFGNTVLQIIIDYCKINGLKEIIQPAQERFTATQLTQPAQKRFAATQLTQPAQKRFAATQLTQPAQKRFTSSESGFPSTFGGSIKPKRHTIVGEAYNNGKSIHYLMEEYNVKQQTILNHLYKYRQEGNKILNRKDLISLSNISSAKQEEVFNQFKTLGTEMLSPVFEALDKEVPYEELHILRLCIEPGDCLEQT
ncbi:RQC domain-containing protein [Desulfamplus magnetovallimortis]|uniref:RQC domain-containing protein n=1 Tax=Desulfamplus magnetovallimortis TaxID=1246637 RepID=UPI001C94FD6A|nr:RQC domain-containing protein [Desulfamplus magnetovallimortis]